MKKIFISLILFSLTTYILSKQNNEWRLDSTYSYQWDFNANTWKLRECYMDMSYSMSGGIIRYQYDARNRIVQESFFEFDTLTAGLDESQSTVYEYYDDSTVQYREQFDMVCTKLNDNGQEIEQIDYGWQGDYGWIGFWKDYHLYYTYNTNEREETRYVWNPDSNECALTGRCVHTYDNTGNITEEIHSNCKSTVKYQPN